MISFSRFALVFLFSFLLILPSICTSTPVLTGTWTSDTGSGEIYQSDLTDLIEVTTNTQMTNTLTTNTSTLFTNYYITDYLVVNPDTLYLKVVLKNIDKSKTPHYIHLDRWTVNFTLKRITLSCRARTFGSQNTRSAWRMTITDPATVYLYRDQMKRYLRTLV